MGVVFLTNSSTDLDREHYLCSTIIKTHERSVIPLGRRGVPEDVARWIVTLASSDADWVTGQVLGIDGGFTLA